MNDNIPYYTIELLKTASTPLKTFRKMNAICIIKLQPFFGPYFENKGATIKWRRPQKD